MSLTGADKDWLKAEFRALGLESKDEAHKIAAAKVADHKKDCGAREAYRKFKVWAIVAALVAAAGGVAAAFT